MKFTKLCPKCSSGDIVIVPGFQGAYGAGQFVSTGVFSHAKVNRYVCLRCGYTEHYTDIQNAEKIRSKYKKQDK